LAGQENRKTRRLMNMLEDFAKPALDLSPSRVNEDIMASATSI